MTTPNDSAKEVLRAAREAGEKFGDNNHQKRLYGDIAEAGARAALTAPATADGPVPGPSDELVELRAALASAGVVCDSYAAENQRLHDRATTAEAALAASQAENGRLREALKKAEGALADIGDADREPGDDVAWCEGRAAEVLPADGGRKHG